MDEAFAVLMAPPRELEARLLAGDDATAAFRRQQLEALVVLAWALPAEPVTARQRLRLLGRLQGDETVMVDVPDMAAPPRVNPAISGALGVLDPPAQPASEVVGAAGAAASIAAVRKRREGAAPVPARRSRSYRWALPLAAVLALAALGLGYRVWRLDGEVAGARESLAAARHDAEQLSARLRSAQSGEGEVAALHDRMGQLESQLALVTASGTAVCPLRPARGPQARAAGGMLYVAADHQHWYLRAQNLPPPGEGRAYQLWFLVGEQPVAAGSFELVGDEAVMSSTTMPRGASAALVTVEPTGAAGERPSGPVVLFGHDMAPLL